MLQEVVKQELDTGSVSVNCRDNAGYTPLHEASMNGFVDVARYLLENGADVKSFSYDGTRWVAAFF